MKDMQRLAFGSLVVGLAVLALKYLAYYITGSVALYSDALESIVNVITALTVMLAIYISAKPADKNHHYGHYKIEYFSAIIEGILIVVAAISIFMEAYHVLKNPIPIEMPIPGLIINSVASILNGVWAALLIRTGKHKKSIAIAADGVHLLSDVLSSVGVVAGLILALITGWTILDPLLACAVAIHILYAGYKLIWQSVGGLMDQAPSTEQIAQIESIIKAHSGQAIEFHDLRVRDAGRMIFIDFHLVVMGNMTVTDSHAICDQIEDALKEAFEFTIVSIHVEPSAYAHQKLQM